MDIQERDTRRYIKIDEASASSSTIMAEHCQGSIKVIDTTGSWCDVWNTGSGPGYRCGSS